MQQLATDIFRPKMHFTPPYGWMNDPNGLVYINDEYHLFYQYYPYGNKWGPMHWGHAVSADLLNWNHLPPALVPDETGMCFSGSAVIDWNNTSGLFDDNTQPGVMAFYTACIAPTDGTDGIQMQSMAYSQDGGFSWQKLAQNPVLENPGLKDFRDPKVIWHSESQHWIMVITEGQEIGFYRSQDLQTWEKTSTFGAQDGAHDPLPWECPDLFPIQLEGSDDIYWILIVGVQGGSFAGGSGTQYFIGQFDGCHFTNHYDPETVLWLDYGRDYYAAQTWSDVTDNSRVSVAWMSNWQYANEVPTTSWRSAMSLPRCLKLAATTSGLRLLSTLPNEWALQTTPHVAQGKTLNAGHSLALRPQFEVGVMQAELELAIHSVIEILPLGNDSLIYQISRDEIGYQVTTTRTVARLGEPKYNQTFAYQKALEIPVSDTLSLTAVLDRCSSELMLQNGEFCITDLNFDDCVDSLKLRCVEGSAKIHQLSFISHDNIQQPIRKLA